MGHMFNNTIQMFCKDVKEQGKNACWVPGTDHTIATEAKVVQKLRESGLKKVTFQEMSFTRVLGLDRKHGGII